MSERVTEARSGVYVITLIGSKVAYVGESANMRARVKQHMNRWVLPNEAEVDVAREMPGSTSKERRRVEHEVGRQLRREGYLVLGLDPVEHSIRAGKASAAAYTTAMRKATFARMTPEQRRARLNNAHAKLSPEDYVKAGVLGGAASLLAYPPDARSAKMKAYCASLSPEQRIERARRAIEARRKVTFSTNSGSFTTERLKWKPLAPEHKKKISDALKAYKRSMSC